MFDKVFGDDTAPLESWQHFYEFKYYGELQDVLSGKDGRTGESERILSYNYGLALFDTFFASKIYARTAPKAMGVPLKKVEDKYWL